MNEMREKIACDTCLRKGVCDSTPTLNGRPKHSKCNDQLKLADQILSLETDTHRIAVIKKGEPPLEEQLEAEFRRGFEFARTTSRLSGMERLLCHRCQGILDGTVKVD